MAKPTETLKLDLEDRDAILRIAKRRGVSKHALLVAQVKRLIAEDEAERDADWFSHFTDGRRQEIHSPDFERALDDIDGSIVDIEL